MKVNNYFLDKQLSDLFTKSVENFIFYGYIIVFYSSMLYNVNVCNINLFYYTRKSTILSL